MKDDGTFLLRRRRLFFRAKYRKKHRILSLPTCTNAEICCRLMKIVPESLQGIPKVSWPAALVLTPRPCSMKQKSRNGSRQVKIACKHIHTTHLPRTHRYGSSKPALPARTFPHWLIGRLQRHRPNTGHLQGAPGFGPGCRRDSRRRRSHITETLQCPAWHVSFSYPTYFHAGDAARNLVAFHRYYTTGFENQAPLNYDLTGFCDTFRRMKFSISYGER